jgi:hypothetical protein
MRIAKGSAALAVVSALLLAACSGSDEETRTNSMAAQLASEAVVDRNPYAIACGHVQDQQTWASVTRRATVAIADQEQFRNLNRLRATQSLFFAMTELCKGRPRTYQPARAAVRGVQQGKFKAGLATP